MARSFENILFNAIKDVTHLQIKLEKDLRSFTTKSVNLVKRAVAEAQKEAEEPKKSKKR